MAERMTKFEILIPANDVEKIRDLLDGVVAKINTRLAIAGCVVFETQGWGGLNDDRP